LLKITKSCSTETWKIIFLNDFLSLECEINDDELVFQCQTSINHFLPTTFQNFISHAQIHSLLKSNIWPLAREFSKCEYLVVFLNSCGYLHLPKTPSSNFSRDSPDSPIGFASTCQNLHIRQTPINHFKPTTLQNFISHELVESTDTLSELKTSSNLINILYLVLK